MPERSEGVKRSTSSSSLSTSQKASFRSKNGKKSTERMPEMTTKEMMTISEKLLTKLKESMVALTKKTESE